MMKKYIIFFLGAILFTLSCSEKENEDKPDNQTDDPWEEVRDVSPGEIKFDGDYFCYYDCGNDMIICGQRRVCDCDISQYHPEWVEYDCYFGTDFPEDADQETFSDGDEFGLFWIICFCGRSGNQYSGTYSLQHVYNSCEDIHNSSPRDAQFGSDWDGDCVDNCNPCVANCSNRECGPDGCGGSCGTCPAGETCSMSGKCIDESSEDPCTECLESCRGLPGCCTGCGCLCEEECGQCF